MLTVAVFKYRFIVPTDPEKKEHIVVWDYNTGLTRITPFFKACKYSKVHRCFMHLSVIVADLSSADYTSESSQRESRSKRDVILHHWRCTRDPRLLDALRLRPCHVPHLRHGHTLGSYTHLRLKLHP